MLLVLAVSTGLLAWSLVGNLVFGETLYVARNLVLTVGLLVFARYHGTSWSALGLDRSSWPTGLRWGGIAALVVAVALAIGTVLGDHVGPVATLLGDTRADLPRPELLYQVLIRIPLGTALFEEVAFRGVLLGLLLRTTSPWAAVALSSVVFGLWHVAPTVVALRLNDVAIASSEGLLAILGAVAVTMVAGVLFSWLRLVSGSLLAPVLAHWATNSIGLLAAAWTQS